MSVNKKSLLSPRCAKLRVQWTAFLKTNRATAAELTRIANLKFD